MKAAFATSLLIGSVHLLKLTRAAFGRGKALLDCVLSIHNKSDLFDKSIHCIITNTYMLAAS